MILRTRLIDRRYRLERRIALSDTTETWLGFDSVLHRAVAVSLPRQELLREAAFIERFAQRSQIATALHHRGIIAAFDSGSDDDLPYLVTEYLGGESLSHIIRAEAPLDIDDVAILIEQLASALDYAHDCGFAHGELTPDDVIVDAQGAAKILRLGFPIDHGPASIDSDIAALGTLAFEMLTGEKPSDIEPESATDAYLIDPNIPHNASDIVAIALGEETARFTSPGAFARSLTDWRSFEPREFFTPPAASLDWIEEITASAVPPSSVPAFMDYDDFAEEISSPAAQPGRRFSGPSSGWFMIALLILLLAAGVVVWHSTEARLGETTTLPPQLEQLAQISGF